MNEKIVCPKCGKEIPSNAELCISCGTRVKEKTVTTKNTEKTTSSRQTIALICLVIAVVGIIVLFAYRAWLGGLIYLAASGISFMTLNGDYEANNSLSLPSYVMTCIKGKDIWNKIIALIVVIIPIVLMIASYRWIVVDTARQVEDIMSSIY